MEAPQSRRRHKPCEDGDEPEASIAVAALPAFQVSDHDSDQLVRLHIKLMAGDMLEVELNRNQDVSVLKQVIMAQLPHMFLNRFSQCHLVLMQPDSDDAPWLALDNERTLASYDITHESEINLINTHRTMSKAPRTITG